MKKLVLCALVAMTSSAFIAPSHAAPPVQPQGQKCTFNSSTDVTREAGWQIGVLRAGPLVTAEHGTLHCAIHVNNNAHLGAESASVDYSTTGDALVVGAGSNPSDPTADQVLHYQATAADDISLCTTWHGDSGTLYWVGGNVTTGQLGYWTADANDPLGCGVATSIEPNDPECRIWKAIDNRLGTNIAEIWQDCEPYPPII